MNENYLPALKPPANLTLEEVRKKFESWRETRKGRQRIPKELWGAAITLSKEHSINKVSKALRVNYTELSNRIHGTKPKKPIRKSSPPAFIELDFGKGVTSECIVEMEKRCGAKMRMCFRGKTDFDPLSLSKAFWNKGS